ncbi:hypothetical protein [uncultured Sphingomonas sp.]|uniref:hypothetical protein n=1 Tax=uncultured Sphingomonas sp. TaxID=158754 RepID=UPI00261053DF|nr:hypothetical protein [uncultured Sphingomonas sp.]
MSDADTVEKLFATLRWRETPETVAKMIRDALPADRAAKLRAPLAEVVGQSLKRVCHNAGGKNLQRQVTAIGSRTTQPQ